MPCTDSELSLHGVLPDRLCFDLHGGVLDKLWQEGLRQGEWRRWGAQSADRGRCKRHHLCRRARWIPERPNYSVRSQGAAMLTCSCDSIWILILLLYFQSVPCGFTNFLNLSFHKLFEFVVYEMYILGCKVECKNFCFPVDPDLCTWSWDAHVVGGTSCCLETWWCYNDASILRSRSAVNLHATLLTLSATAQQNDSVRTIYLQLRVAWWYWMEQNLTHSFSSRSGLQWIWTIRTCCSTKVTVGTRSKSAHKNQLLVEGLEVAAHGFLSACHEVELVSRLVWRNPSVKIWEKFWLICDWQRSDDCWLVGVLGNPTCRFAHMVSSLATRGKQQPILSLLLSSLNQ